MLKSYESVARCIQMHVSQLFTINQQERDHHKKLPERDSLVPAPSGHTVSNKGKSVAPLTKEELGRATWTLLHMIAAQYPDRPSRQQKRDAKELMAIISRLYPCNECADHFKEILRANPVLVGSQEEFSLWLCHVHNVVNRSLGKLIFPCERVSARWGKLDCENGGCDLEGTSDSRTP